MGTTTFLINEALWQTITDTIRNASHIDAAIAYFGTGGAQLFPLRRGHRLVVDMSPGAVKAGNTNPYEIAILLKRGVEVFTRRDLHAKVIVADKVALVGSANVSKNSKQNLDEAAIASKEISVVRRAVEFIKRICTEPVRPEYLEECKKTYRPPRQYNNERKSTKRVASKRVTHAKLWIVKMTDYSIPDAEIERYEKGEKKAVGLLNDSRKSETTSFHWPYRPKMADELQTGDWIIQCIKYKDNNFTVWPPAQLLFIDRYIRNSKTGKERFVFHLEIPKQCQKMEGAEFKKAANTVLSDALVKPRTKAIRVVTEADDLLRFWTPAGRIAKRKKKK